MKFLKLLVMLMVMLMVMLVCLPVFGEEAANVAAEATPTTLAIIFGCLFAVSEVLASIPALKVNSIFQLIKTILAALVGKK